MCSVYTEALGTQNEGAAECLQMESHFDCCDIPNTGQFLQYSTHAKARFPHNRAGPQIRCAQYWISKQRTAHMYPPYTTLRYSTCHYWAQILTFHLLPKRESIQKSRVVAETYISRIMTPNTHLKLSSHARHINSMCSTVHWTVLKNYQIWRICRCTSALAFRTRIYKNVKLRVHENEI